MSDNDKPGIYGSYTPEKNKLPPPPPCYQVTGRGNNGYPNSVKSVMCDDMTQVMAAWAAMWDDGYERVSIASCARAEMKGGKA